MDPAGYNSSWPLKTFAEVTKPSVLLITEENLDLYRLQCKSSVCFRYPWIQQVSLGSACYFLKVSLCVEYATSLPSDVLSMLKRIDVSNYGVCSQHLTSIVNVWICNLLSPSLASGFFSSIKQFSVLNCFIAVGGKSTKVFSFFVKKILK